jgi:hypothetical protein
MCLAIPGLHCGYHAGCADGLCRVVSGPVRASMNARRSSLWATDAAAGLLPRTFSACLAGCSCPGIRFASPLVTILRRFTAVGSPGQRLWGRRASPHFSPADGPST